MGIVVTEPRCSEQVYESGGWGHRHQCERKGALVEDGKPWCKQHAPSSKQARRSKSDERFRVQSEEWKKKWHLDRAAPDLLAAAKLALDFIQSLPYEPSIAPSTKAQDALVDAIAKAEGRS